MVKDSGVGSQIADGDALSGFQEPFEPSVLPPTCSTSDGNLILEVNCSVLCFPCGH